MREAGRADSQSYLWRIRGFYGGLRAGIVTFPQNKGREPYS